MTPLELQAIRDRLSYSQKVRKDLPHKVTVTYNACVLSDIAALLAEVERLKCCGNCRHWYQELNQCVEPEFIKQYGDSGNWSDRTDTCDKWERE